MTETDLQLLARYTRDHAENAFTEIVRRHVNLVYSAALRQVRSPQLAEEVAQSVFTDLARNAHRLAPDTTLTAWLYQVTCRTAIDVVRREARRQLRERIATEMNAINATATDWTHIEPLLDEAMSALDDTDRAAVLLRYFENKSLREVGATLGTSDDAAQKRVSRAVERLREFFDKRGVTIGANGLVFVISANAVQAAPIGLAVTISTAAALTGTTLATTATATATKALALTAIQKTLIGGALVVVVAAGIYEARQTARLKTEVRNLREQQAPLSEEVTRLTTENDRLSNLLVQANGFGVGQSGLFDDAKSKETQQRAAGGYALSELEFLLREASKLPDAQRPKRLEEIARSIAIPDVPAAVTLAEGILASDQDRFSFQAMAILHWAESDPEGALNFAMAYNSSKENSAGRQKIIAYVLHGWATKDAEAALAWVERLPDGADKQNYFAVALTALADSNPGKAFGKLKEMPAGRARDRLLQGIASVWGNKDPKAAAEFGKSLPAGSSRDQFLQQLAAIWIGKDPKAAVNFILELPASGSRDELLRNAVSAWARTDPAAAAKFSETMPFNRMWGMTGVAYNWAISDPAAAWQWSLSIADDETRRSSLGGVLRCLATRSKLDEAAMYAAQLTGDDQVRAVRSLLIDSSDLDPDWTARWVAKFPAGETRNQAVEKLVQHWSESDPIATAKWLGEQPQDAAFQSGARRLIPGMLKSSPSMAWDWAIILTDPAIKQERLEMVAKSWLGSDANAARAKIQSSDLPPDQITKLLEQKH